MVTIVKADSSLGKTVHLSRLGEGEPVQFLDLILDRLLCRSQSWLQNMQHLRVLKNLQ